MIFLRQDKSNEAKIYLNLPSSYDLEHPPGPFLCNKQMVVSKTSFIMESNTVYGLFLAHQSWRLKWAFLITICPLAVVDMFVVINFSHFLLPFQNQPSLTKLSTKQSLVNMIQVCSRTTLFFKGDYKKGVNILTKYKNLLLQNRWANFNQTCHKTSLGEGDSSFSNEAPSPFPKENNTKIAKINLTKF